MEFSARALRGTSGRAIRLVPSLFNRGTNRLQYRDGFSEYETCRQSSADLK
jgi:hypothetical protein